MQPDGVKIKFRRVLTGVVLDSLTGPTLITKVRSALKQLGVSLPVYLLFDTSKLFTLGVARSTSASVTSIVASEFGSINNL